MAHDLVPHIKKVLCEARTPVSIGAVLYVPFPKSHAGTTYEVQHVADGPGVVDDTTEIVAAAITTRICRTARSTSPSRTSAA